VEFLSKGLKRYNLDIRKGADLMRLSSLYLFLTIFAHKLSLTLTAKKIGHWKKDETIIDKIIAREIRLIYDSTCPNISILIMATLLQHVLSIQGFAPLL